ncbi:hypothetical protein RB595_001611 [Gaeumannomyces hyphopodioides]
MSASSIPNLLSLRGARGGARGRAQRRGGGGGGGGPSAARGAGHDATIQGTDTDAAVSRLSAVELGYLQDPFAQYFVQQAGPGPSTRRLPIINRGTYTRTSGLDTFIDRFVAAPEGADERPQERQIVSLGAGTDTRSLRLLSRPGVSGIVYHEIDFPLICAKKLNIIKAPALRHLLSTPTVEDDGSSWCCQTPDGKSQLHFHGLDLRQLTQQPEESPLKGLRTDIPTLLVSECCLCYLETSEARDVIKWFADKIPNLGVLIYEPTKPDDPFGKTMVSNLAARGIAMPTLQDYRLPADQDARLKALGLEHARHLTVDNVWANWVPEPEKERVDSLEGLDEVEEWKLLAGHYVISWGWRGSGFRLWEDL